MTRNRILGLALVAACVAAPAALGSRDDVILVSVDPETREPAGTGVPQQQIRTMSADGRYVVFVTSSNPQAYVHDLVTGELELVSRASGPDGEMSNDSVDEATISADGRYVAFTTSATNLPGDDANDQDTFRRDRETDETLLVTRSADPADDDLAYGSTPSISGDGSRIAFVSGSSEIQGAEGVADGTGQVFVFDAASGDSVVVSRDPQGDVGEAISAEPQISRDGSRVAFRSGADNLSEEDDNTFDNVFFAEVDEPRSRLVSVPPGDGPADGSSYPAAITADGSRVLFDSAATNLSDEDDDSVTDVFAWDEATGEITLISRGPDGPATGSSTGGAMSGDGRYVAFQTEADDIAGLPEHEDSFSGQDIVWLDLLTGDARHVSRAGGADGVDGDGASYLPSISDDGRFVAFISFAGSIHPRGESLEVYRREVWALPRVLAAPQVAGVPAEGRSVSCAGAAFAEATGVQYAWLRDGAAIPGAATVNYTVAAADVGRPIACQAIGTSPDGPAVATSPPVTGLPARVSPMAVSFDVRPARDRRAPYRYRIAGRVILPAGMTKERACNGRVRIRARKGSRAVAVKRPRVRSACAFKAKLNVSARRARSRRGKLRLTVRFLGNDALLPRSATARRLRFGR